VTKEGIVIAIIDAIKPTFLLYNFVPNKKTDIPVKNVIKGGKNLMKASLKPKMYKKLAIKIFQYRTPPKLIFLYSLY